MNLANVLGPLLVQALGRSLAAASGVTALVLGCVLAAAHLEGGPPPPLVPLTVIAFGAGLAGIPRRRLDEAESGGREAEDP